MIPLIVETYTFDKVAKTITAADFVDVEKITAIIHQPSGEVIYQINNPAKGGTLAGTVLTLDYDTNTGVFNNADPLLILYHTNLINTIGRLKTSTEPSLQDPVTDTITSNGDTVRMNVERTSNIAIHCFGTFSTVNVIFEASLNSTDGVNGNWFTVQMVRTNANTVETATGNLSAAPAYGWEGSVNGYAWFRVRATAFTSGTQTWIFRPAPYATEPIPGIQVTATQPISGTITASNTTGPAATDAAVSGNPVYIAGRASDARPARMSADNDVVPAWRDRHGASVVEIGGPRGLKGRQRTTITSSTAETTIVTAGGASIFRDVYRILVHNTSAVTTVVTIRDATAGTVVFPPITLAAGEKWGFSAPSSDAEVQAVANNNWTAQCSVAVASVEITTSFISRL